MRARRGVVLLCVLAILAGIPDRMSPSARAPNAARAQVSPGPPAGSSAPAPAPTPAPPGTLAPLPVVQELQAALAQGVQRFEAKDLAGVLSQVSDQYWTGPLTKSTLRAQLLTIFQVYQQVRARVRIDEVRMVDGHAWVYSTGDVSGQLPFLAQWMTLFSWERELEVARRESQGWRLFGYQQ